MAEGKSRQMQRDRELKTGFLKKDDFFGGFEVVFLGTSGSKPTLQRACSCTALKLPKETYVFDVGEGMQTQMMSSQRIQMGSVSKIFISHMHGDHVFGLPGLITAIDNIKTEQMNPSRIQPIDIYGPEGVGYMLDMLRLTSTFHTYPRLRVHEFILPNALQENRKRPPRARTAKATPIFPDRSGVYDVHEDENVVIKATTVPHKPGMPSFAFAVQEKQIKGRLDIERLLEEGVEPGPLLGLLKDGETVVLPNGKRLDGKEYVGPPRPGRKFAIVSDTSDSRGALDLVHGADVLVHESTYCSDMYEKAKFRGHSTCIHAAQLARDAEVGTLALTHFSCRYMKTSHVPMNGSGGFVSGGTNKMKAEASRVHTAGEVICAEDFLSVSLPMKISRSDEKLVKSVKGAIDESTPRGRSDSASSTKGQ